MRARHPGEKCGLGLFSGDAKHQGHCTIIGCTASTQTPVKIVRRMWAISGSVAEIRVAKTISTGGFTTAIVVGNYVILPIMGIIAGAYPGNG